MRRLLSYIFYGIAIGFLLFLLGVFAEFPALGKVIYDNP